ncbi:putative glutamine amidotransferase [Kandleria vitulina]|uniref:gamma-glutamyl-gamma-aminobutyrate hydrolase family protein n=1 Tax=Kandleria vitulina TaxID=1630 RepID=UPI0008CE72F6|nr:gamma-glutamyl-gamma-aminobutyrate hydrolase family protein [Kandleria vitulina]SEI65232.1 putative glutamine amidotransferase [Kandleria vitulina]
MGKKKKPVIGIAGNVLKDSGGMFPGYRRSYVNEDYNMAVIQNGGVPFIIPVSQSDEVIEEQVSMIDGLIISGGSDISSLEYEEEPLPLLGDILPERDYFDRKLLDVAIKRQIPILGICRGIQFINVYHGGTLYQDHSYYGKDVIRHWQGHDPDVKTHHVHLEKESKLYDIYNNEDITVNSFHHQSVKDLGKGLKITGKSKDGIIEGVESIDYPFMVAVQWHPEMLFRTDEGSNRLFKIFIEKSSERKEL